MCRCPVFLIKLPVPVALGVLVYGSFCASLHGGLLPVPNASFESPATSFVNINTDAWQKARKPDWYVEGGGLMWDQLVGTFRNTPQTSFDHIANCHSNQAIWLFAVPEVALFQDYETIDWNDPVPTHGFDATFQIGKAYRLSVGLLVGTGAGGPMQQGVPLDLRLYYRDAASNRVAVATTTVTNSSAIFSNSTHLLDYHVTLPVVQTSDPWAGRHIGIEFASMVSSNMQGGYWDLDHVRLLEFAPPILSVNGGGGDGFRVSLTGEPGLHFEILATTNLLLPTAGWTSVALITNVIGEASFTDSETNFVARFYQARLLP